MKEVILPSKEEIIARLTALDAEPHFREKLYPKIARHGGTQKAAEGVNLIMVLAVHDYTADLPPMLFRRISGRIPEFIRAVIDDADVRDEAIAIYHETHDGNV